MKSQFDGCPATGVWGEGRGGRDKGSKKWRGSTFGAEELPLEDSIRTWDTKIMSVYNFVPLLENNFKLLQVWFYENHMVLNPDNGAT